MTKELELQIALQVADLLWEWESSDELYEEAAKKIVSLVLESAARSDQTDRKQNS